MEKSKRMRERLSLRHGGLCFALLMLFLACGMPSARGQEGLARFAGPGHWNGPDMLEVGNGHMTTAEYPTHMSLWCILAAPPVSGKDLAHMSQSTLAMLTMIAVDRDPAGIEGYRIYEEGPLQVWVKPLAGGGRAVGLFNAGESTMPVTVHFKDIGVSGPASVRDLWARKDLGTFNESFTAHVPRHGVVMIRIKAGG